MTGLFGPVVDIPATLQRHPLAGSLFCLLFILFCYLVIKALKESDKR